MPQPLSVNRLIRTSVTLSPLAAQRRGFGTLLILGDSGVVDPVERARAYTSADSVAADFGSSAPEYLAAQLYFGQTPKPQQVMIGPWLRTASRAQIRGGVLTTAEQRMDTFTPITAGSLQITIDGTNKTLSGLNFSAQTNLNGVAAVITTALASGVVVWNGSQFVVRSNTTGATSTLGYASPTGTGTDISTKLKLTSGLASAPVNGRVAETPIDAANAAMTGSNAWFGLTFAASSMPTDDQLVSVAQAIEAASVERMFGVTITNALVLDGTQFGDLGARLAALSLSHTVSQYSGNPYAVASFFGRMFSVNFAANRSTITGMYKTEPGVAPELLTEAQAQALKAKRVNVYVSYQNGTSILQYAVTASGAYFDEIHGLAWFKDALQNRLFNILYQSQTKVPQTDDGQNQLKAGAALACEDAITNGLAAPGQWNADGFGQLARGDFLRSGYYIYSPPMAAQSQADREARIAQPIQIALKLAGAIHEIDALVSVNR